MTKDKPKMSISVDRSMTINTGNYSSIKPGVSLTMTVNEGDDLKEKYMEMSDLLDCLMALETITLGKEMASVQKLGPFKYVDALGDNAEKIMDKLSEFKV